MNRLSKSQLLDKIIYSISYDDWNYFFLSDPKTHPFRLKVFKENESYNVRIYIWNLTHGGGARRPVDEYRIQITPRIERFESEMGGKTLILGWWEEGEVFAGFDITKHSGILGYSPSIQIREEALRKAYINGFSPWKKESGEIAISFKPDFFVEYIRNLESLHSFGESVTDFEVLEEVSESPDKINDAIIQNVSQTRQLAVSRVTRKVRDNSFKSRVLTAYSRKCAFCGIQLNLVEAAHILPVSYDGSTDETSNGFSLCPLHHKAYDISLITINNKYQILYNENTMEKLKETGLDGGMEKFISDLRPIIHLPPAPNDRPHIEYIQKSNEIRGWTIEN